MSIPKGINFIWSGSGFGNALILTHLTQICIDNEIKAVFTQHKTTAGLVDVPLYSERLHGEYIKDGWLGIRNTYLKKNVDEPCLKQYIKHVEKIFDKNIEISESHDHVPVKYYDISDTYNGVDVCLNTATGSWSKYRIWPYFEQLKKLLTKNKISYIDLNAGFIYGIRCLNYVNKSRLYVGLETGMSHYVSKYANNKALIIQSGFCPFYYWAGFYKYDFISCNSQCSLRPCFLTKKEANVGIICRNDHGCMNGITADMVFEEIRKRLSL